MAATLRAPVLCRYTWRDLVYALAGLRPGTGPVRATTGVRALRRAAIRHGLIVIYLLGIAASLIIGWVLEHEAFTPPSPAGQAFAAAFVQDRRATVTLSAAVNPDRPWRDHLTVHVRGAKIGQDRWLLVIECPPGSAASRHPGSLVSEFAAQAPVLASTVTVYSGAGPSRTVGLGCFIRTRSNSLNKSNTPGYASIGGVTLPALETDQAIEDAETSPVMYAGQGGPGSPAHLLQVFPGAACPSLAPAPTQSAPAPSASSSAAATGPRASQKPTSAPGGSTSPSPSPGIPGCYGQFPAGKTPSKYYLPASMQTKEVLTNVNLNGYQIESIFPTAQITNDKGGPGQNYSWTGYSSLSPSLIVSNLAGQQKASHYTFIAGILLGIAGGTAAPFLEKVWSAVFPNEDTPRGSAAAGQAATPARSPSRQDERPGDD